MKINWYELVELPLKRFGDVPESSGVYVLRWSRHGMPVSIPRLGGVDPNGILYFGSAKNLRRRIRGLWNAIKKEKVEAHTVSKTIIFCRFFEIACFDELEITWETLETHEVAVRQEWAAIRAYASKYHEPPPLNLSVNRKRYAIGGIVKTWTERIASPPDEFVKFIINS